MFIHLIPSAFYLHSFPLLHFGSPVEPPQSSYAMSLFSRRRHAEPLDKLSISAPVPLASIPPSLSMPGLLGLTTLPMLAARSLSGSTLSSLGLETTPTGTARQSICMSTRSSLSSGMPVTPITPRAMSRASNGSASSRASHQSVAPSMTPGGEEGKAKTSRPSLRKMPRWASTFSLRSLERPTSPLEAAEPMIIIHPTLMDRESSLGSSSQSLDSFQIHPKTTKLDKTRLRIFKQWRTSAKAEKPVRPPRPSPACSIDLTSHDCIDRKAFLRSVVQATFAIGPPPLSPCHSEEDIPPRPPTRRGHRRTSSICDPVGLSPLSVSAAAREAWTLGRGSPVLYTSAFESPRPWRGKMGGAGRLPTISGSPTLSTMCERGACSPVCKSPASPRCVRIETPASPRGPHARGTKRPLTPIPPVSAPSPNLSCYEGVFLPNTDLEEYQLALAEALALADSCDGGSAVETEEEYFDAREAVAGSAEDALDGMFSPRISLPPPRPSLMATVIPEEDETISPLAMPSGKHDATFASFAAWTFPASVA